MSTLDEFAEAKLRRLEADGIRRNLAETRRIDGVRAERDGRMLISFCCNDYLNLSQHPAVKRAAREAVDQYGAGAGASRLVTGNHPLYGDLETRLARLKETEAACVFGSGYLANAGAIPVLAGAGDLIVIDELAHASAHGGVRLSRAETVLFAHNDLDHCRRVLRDSRAGHPRCLILTEGVFSMDGDRAPISGLVELAHEFDAWLMVDDAHGCGVIDGGKGATTRDVDLHMGTLSKALGAYGGFVCASRPVIDLIRGRARSLVYSTGLPPAVIAAALAALDVIAAEPDRVARPLTHARLFTTRLNLPPAESPIGPVSLGYETPALEAAAARAERGFLVTAIRPPTVPAGTARLRFTFTADHTPDEIARLADAVIEIGAARP